MADAGIANGMPSGVTDFVVVSYSQNPPPPHPSCVYQILKALVKGYPDRLNLLISAPVSSIVEIVMVSAFVSVGIHPPKDPNIANIV